jgi:3-methyladenine DNA glycosylase AlkD
MANKADTLLKTAKQIFIQNANPTHAFAMSKYMKFNFVFYGIKNPLRKRLQSEILNLTGKLDIETIKEFSHQAWYEPEREMQYFVIDLLISNRKKLDENDLHLMVFLIENKSWWDTVDAIASNLVGFLLKKYPNEEFIKKCINSTNLWLQRTAIIHQLTYKKDTKEELLFELCKIKLNEKEFFIRKAIGWALRQYAKFAPEAVINFIKTNDLSNLSKREAIKNINI